MVGNCDYKQNTQQAKSSVTFKKSSAFKCALNIRKNQNIHCDFRQTHSDSDKTLAYLLCSFRFVTARRVGAGAAAVLAYPDALWDFFPLTSVQLV